MSNEFARAARAELENAQLRANIRHATHTIREKRALAAAELGDWEQLGEAGKRIKERAIRHLDVHLEQLERSVSAAGGIVHWAADGAQANRIVIEAAGALEVVKVKSLATDAARGIHAQETDLAELIIQLGHDRPSHIPVPAIHRNRGKIRELFRRELPGSEHLDDDPAALAEAARRFLRAKFLAAKVGVSGANFAVAETGTVCILESEGNGHVHDAARGADHCDGDREGAAALRRPRSDAAAAAALLHRRANEPVHDAVERDRGAARIAGCRLPRARAFGSGKSGTPCARIQAESLIAFASPRRPSYSAAGAEASAAASAASWA